MAQFELRNQPTVAFRWHDLQQEVSSLREPVDVYLHTVATFSVEVLRELIYREDLFPVVEFGIKSQRWLSEVSLTEENFIFTSLDAEEQGLVWFRREQSGWKIGSVFQSRQSKGALPLKDIRQALNEYYTTLRTAVRDSFDFDINDLLPGDGVGGVGHP